MPAAVPKGKDAATDAPLEPCAATGSLLLLAQGPVVLCLHHDSLAVDRRFTKHTDDVQLIAVDNVSESGAGRLVVTYDARQTAIVWDLFTGEQISRFASYEPLKVASWMRNGNIAFGNGKGEVIFFEPSTSEHISARTIFDPITAIAPSSDCKNYAIGYNNGSILLAALQPSFTILHTLTTSRAPSPIAALSWHASSSKQKSDMLATQTADGDLRVWSVAKPPTVEPPRVIRVLRRNEPAFLPGRTWISWSKNGRIIQYSENETWSWDVRTKHVTYDQVPVVDGVRALAAYGPSATMFTLGPDHTVQQYDIEHFELVKNVRHLPPTIPPTPPEEARQVPWSTSESEEDAKSPAVRHGAAAHAERNRITSPDSQLHSNLSRTSRGKHSSRHKDMISPAHRSELTGTIFSAGTGSYLQDNLGQYNKSPSSSRSARKASRLRQEVVMSPQDRPVDDLFPFVRARLSDVPYKPPRSIDETRMTPANLRRQMLSVVFGWEEDIRDLIRDELSRHPPEGQHAIFLSRWLNEDPEYLAKLMGATSVTSNIDWMLLALGTVSHEIGSQKISQVFIEKMLSRGDIHAVATLLVAVGDYSDAIEVYVSRNQFLEAVLLTCLVTPSDWQRQSYLVRRWGEFVVENSQQQLAIRCFSCTGVEPSEPWTSPTAQMATRGSEPVILAREHHPEEPLEYPEIFRKTIERRRTLDAGTPVAMPPPATASKPAAADASDVPQTSALKLITSFDAPSNTRYKFPGLKSDDRTPTHGAAVTPIAESAIDRSALSPGGTGNYRLNNIRSLTQAMSARTPAAYHRHRLPSIGETPIDVEAPPFRVPSNPRRLPTPADSSSDKEKDRLQRELEAQTQNHVEPTLMMLSSARYDPATATPVHETPQTALRPGAAAEYFRKQQHHGADGDPSIRKGSRNRKPEGLSIDTGSTSGTSEGRQGRATRPKTTESRDVTAIETSTSELTSPPMTGYTYGTATTSTKSPSVAASRSIDQYISSLDQSQYYSQQSHAKGHSSSKAPRDERRRHRQQAGGEDERRSIPRAKRSPSSPVPMSPDDVRMYSGSLESFDAALSNMSNPERLENPASQSKLSRRRSHSKREGKHRHRSRSKDASRPRSPDYRTRGRSSSRKESLGRRSPSSPLPMVPSEEDRASTDPSLRLVSADRRQGNRSGSRKPSRDRSAQNDRSPDRRKHRQRSRSRQPEDQPEGRVSRKSSVSARSGEKHRHRRRDRSQQAADKDTDVPTTATTLDPEDRPASTPSLSDRKRKELAAAELEARRLSLARRPSAPNIPFPGHGHGKSASDSQSQPQAPPLFRANTDDAVGHLLRSRRPSTPRAMQVTPTTRVDSLPGASAKTASEPKPSSSSKQHVPPPIDPLPTTVYQSPQIEQSTTGNSSVFSPMFTDNSTGKPYSPNMNSLTSPRPGSSRSYSHSAIDLTRMQLPTDTSSSASLAQLPRHPAYDSRIAGSRSSSKNRLGERDSSRSRGTSRDRTQMRVSPREVVTMTIGGPTSTATGQTDPAAPAVLPELQHLASPPPPPPPPPPPKNRPIPEPIRMDSTASTDATRVPLPLSALSTNVSHVPTSGEISAGPLTGGSTTSHHRRGRSGNGVNGNGSDSAWGKMRSFAGRMRSSSRGREGGGPAVLTKSPPPGSFRERVGLTGGGGSDIGGREDGMGLGVQVNTGPMPYETNVGDGQYAKVEMPAQI